MLKGFQSFDPEIRIAGVILNNIKGGSHKAKATTAIEHYCGVPVIGAIPRMEEMHLAMRHLGLVPYREGSGRGDFDDRIAAITEMIGQYVDLDRFVSLMKEEDVPAGRSPAFDPSPERDVKIAVALDEAFNFYYSDLFDILHALGAESIPFSPVHDRLPDADGYIIGGGYPELFVRELEANDRMREGLREVSRNGVPVYAECGGLMYLTDRMTLKKGWQGSEKDQSGDMCGIFPGETRMPARRVVSYVEGTSEAGPLGKGAFRGHEFHYSDVDLGPGHAVCLPPLPGGRDPGQLRWRGCEQHAGQLYPPAPGCKQRDVPAFYRVVPAEALNGAAGRVPAMHPGTGKESGCPRRHGCLKQIMSPDFFRQ